MTTLTMLPGVDEIDTATSRFTVLPPKVASKVASGFGVSGEGFRKP